jgi:hypothetical protein
MVEINSSQDYSKWYTTVYNGKVYMYNPKAIDENIGWQLMSKNGLPTKVAPKDLQIILNKQFFKSKEAPTIQSRLKKASPSERKLLEKEAISWLVLKIKGLKAGASGIPGTTTAQKRSETFKEGGMYFFAYDAKYKKELPYWDKFPLIILLEPPQGGLAKTHFLGLNLHYLPIEQRAMFLAQLSMAGSKLNKDKEIRRLLTTYQKTLKGNVNLSAYKPCIKLYIIKNLQSRVLQVQPHEWMYAIHLPYENFQNETKENVWKNSLSEINKKPNKKSSNRSK